MKDQTIFKVCSFEAKNRVFEFDNQKTNTFKIVMFESGDGSYYVDRSMYVCTFETKNGVF